MSRSYLSKRDESFNREEIVLRYYRRFSVDELSRLSAWSEWDGHDAYRALAIDHFEVVSYQIRTDLETEFQQASGVFYEQELAESRRITAQRSASGLDSQAFAGSLSGNWQRTAARTAEESAQSSLERRKQEYLAAALAGLARHAKPADIKFGRQFLFSSETDVSIEAVKLISRCGTAEDVADLVKLATTSDALLQELAAKAAFHLAENQLDIAAGFLATNDEILISIAVAELILRGRNPLTLSSNHFWTKLMKTFGLGR